MQGEHESATAVLRGHVVERAAHQGLEKRIHHLLCKGRQHTLERMEGEGCRHLEGGPRQTHSSLLCNKLKNAGLQNGVSRSINPDVAASSGPVHL